MRRGLLLVIDQGGRSTRALVYDGGGRFVAGAVATVREVRRGARVELDAAAIWQSVRQAIGEVRRRLAGRAEEVGAAALATQRSTVVCWDRRTGRALSPALSWQDCRAAARIDRLADQAPGVERLTGLRLSPHYGATKMRWCVDHLPAVARAARMGRLAVGPLASFLLYRLTRGESFLLDPANATRTLLYDAGGGDWHQDLLSLFWLDRDWLPRCVPTHYDFGVLHWGRWAIPIRLVSGDQSCALFGLGEPRRGDVYVNAGTGAFLQRPIERPPERSGGLLCSLVYSDAARKDWVLEGTVNGAASAFDWAARRLGVRQAYRRFPKWLAQVRDPPLFLNAVSGLGSPFWRADLESRFAGRGTPAEKMVAVAESVVFLIHANIELMDAAAGRSGRVVLSGGLARLDGLCRRMADLSGRPVYRPAEVEATARGAAFLLAGRPARWPETASGTWFEPRPDALLRRRYAAWREQLALALRENRGALRPTATM